MCLIEEAEDLLAQCVDLTASSSRESQQIVKHEKFALDQFKHRKEMGLLI